MSVLFNATEVAEIAAAQFGDALLDDPSRWPANASIAPADVVAVCEETARENAHSAVTQEIARHKSTLLHECLTVAPDPNAAFQRLVPGLAPDFAEGCAIAKNNPEKWAQEREPAFLRAVAKAIAALPLRPRTTQEILAYAARDDRLSRPGLRKALAATRLPDDAPAMPEDTPAFLRPAQAAPLEDDWGGAFDVPAQAAPAPAPLEDDWGGAFDVPAQAAPAPAPLEDDWGGAFDVPAAPTPAPTPAPAPATRRPRRTSTETRRPPEILQHFVPAGIVDKDIAHVLGISPSYISRIRSGERPWPGLKPDQYERLREEIEARQAALARAAAVLSEPETVRPAP